MDSRFGRAKLGLRCRASNTKQTTTVTVTNTVTGAGTQAQAQHHVAEAAFPSLPPSLPQQVCLLPSTFFKRLEATRPHAGFRTSRKDANARSVLGALEFSFSISRKHRSPLTALASNAADMLVSLLKDGFDAVSSIQKSF